MDPVVDVVIRTAGRPERRSSLQRAIQSVFDQRGITARPLVVLAAHSPELARTLVKGGIKVHQVAERASPGRALTIGRRLVDAEFYAFLDDDDELLPEGLASAHELLCADPAADLVAATGYWISGDQRRIHIPEITRHQDDALNGIIERCWLNPGGGVYRTAAISETYFENLPDLCEWTLLAFRLASSGRRIRFLDVPAYIAYDTPASASKSGEFLEAILGVLSAIRAHSLPAASRHRLEQKYAAALHQAAEHYRRAKQLRKAWRFHLKSLRPPYTLRYAAYTRKLLWQRAAVEP